jgi:hypothetical protein
MQPIENNISPLAKWLAAGISLFFFVYGVLIIATQHYYGRTTKLGGAEVSADGIQAMVMGVGIIIIGLTPMSLWSKSSTVAALWAAFCLFLGLALIIFAPFILR